MDSNQLFSLSLSLSLSLSSTGLTHLPVKEEKGSCHRGKFSSPAKTASFPIKISDWVNLFAGFCSADGLCDADACNHQHPTAPIWDSEDLREVVSVDDFNWSKAKRFNRDLEPAWSESKFSLPPEPDPSLDPKPQPWRVIFRLLDWSLW